uniref:CDK inhibitor n=1 Tax=Mus musculus TaxID=10090 RepID=Q7M0H2_MOUSE
QTSLTDFYHSKVYLSPGSRSLGLPK